MTKTLSIFAIVLLTCTTISNAANKETDNTSTTRNQILTVINNMTAAFHNVAFHWAK